MFFFVSISVELGLRRNPVNQFKTTPFYEEKETRGGIQRGITVEHLVKHRFTEELNPRAASMDELL